MSYVAQLTAGRDDYEGKAFDAPTTLQSSWIKKAIKFGAKHASEEFRPGTITPYII
jgi:hypothetical protein